MNRHLRQAGPGRGETQPRARPVEDAVQGRLEMRLESPRLTPHASAARVEWSGRSVRSGCNSYHDLTPRLPWAMAGTALLAS